MKSSKKGSKNLVLFTAVIIVLFIALFMLNRMTAEKVNGTTAEFAPDIIGQPVIGSDQATVTVVEFGDYKCPSCKAWGSQIYPQLMKSYIDTGKVKFSYVNTLFHGEESTLGAIASESVWSQDPAAFWAFHKGMFDAQPTEDHDGLWITPDKVLEIAKAQAPSIDLEKLKSDMISQSTLPQVNVDTKLVQQFNIRTTPTIMVNNVVVVNPFDYIAITKIIEEQLKS